jgi:hypothetical protein
MKLIFTLVLIGLFAWIAVAQREIGTVQARPTTQTRARNILTEDTKACAAQASAELQEFRRSGGKGDSAITLQTNHFNEKLGKCFVEIRTMDGNPPSVSIVVFDGFEGATYATYGWVNGTQKSIGRLHRPSAQ